MDNHFVGLITWNGKLLAPVTSDRAFRVRCDVQLYYRSPSVGIQPEATPEYFRMHGDDPNYKNALSSFWVNYQYYIEVDPPKPEYEPHDSSSPP